MQELYSSSTEWLGWFDLVFHVDLVFGQIRRITEPDELVLLMIFQYSAETELKHVIRWCLDLWFGESYVLRYMRGQNRNNGWGKIGLTVITQSLRWAQTTTGHTKSDLCDLVPSNFAATPNQMDKLCHYDTGTNRTEYKGLIGDKRSRAMLFKPDYEIYAPHYISKVFGVFPNLSCTSVAFLFETLSDLSSSICSR